MNLSHVAVDARMIRHSGIGTAIRGLLQAWNESPPPFDLTLMGDPDRLPNHTPLHRLADYRMPIYCLCTGLMPAPVGDADVLLATHYAAPLRPGIPLVVIVHDLIHITHPTRRGSAVFMKTWLAALRRRASYIITPSRHTKVQLQTLHGFAAHQVLTLPWGPGLAGLAEPVEPENPNLPDDDFLLSVGIYKPHKNWLFLIRRLAGLWRKGRLDLPLVIAGMSDTGIQELWRIGDKAGVSDRLYFLPRVKDSEMLGIYRRARALLFPSAVEGFGFPIIESMAMGTPVVAADLPPMNEVGGDALLAFDLDNPKSFDRAVMRAISSQSGRREAIERGLAQAARHSWSKLAEGIEEVLERAHAEKLP